MTLSGPKKLEWLGRIPLFRGAQPESLERLAERTGEVAFAPGQYIVQQGQVGNGLFLLVAGGARVVSGPHELARLGPGDVIGELSVIDQMPRGASVIADAPSTCLALASWDLLAILEQDSRLALNLLRELAERLRSANAQIGH